MEKTKTEIAELVIMAIIAIFIISSIVAALWTAADINSAQSETIAVKVTHVDSPINRMISVESDRFNGIIQLSASDYAQVQNGDNIEISAVIVDDRAYFATLKKGDNNG